MISQESLILSSGVNSVIYLKEIFGLNITKSEIRERFKKMLKGNKINLSHISEILSKINIENEAFIIPGVKELRRVNLPVISGISLNNKEGIDFIVITCITSKYIIYGTSQYFLIKEPLKDFLIKWNNIVLAIDKETFKKSINYEKYKLKEDIEKKEYLKSFKVIPNFLSEEQCRELTIQSKHEQVYKKSKVTAGENGQNEIIETYRKSETVFLNNANNNIQRVINSKIKKILKTDDLKIESIQCVKYKKGDFFAPHFDNNSFLKRTHTVLIYLNENFNGGATFFPEINKHIKPKIGKAILFKNTLKGGYHNDPYSLHAGLKIEKGIKFACNVWITKA